MAKAAAFSASVLSRAKNANPGFLPWFRKVPADVQAELEQLRCRWETGDTGLQKRAMARAVVAELRERGYAVPGVQGVEAWLERSGSY